MPNDDSLDQRPLFPRNLRTSRHADDDFAAWQEAEAASAEEEEYRRSEERDQIIKNMVKWFEFQFEDPHNQTPYDEEGGYDYLWGGPFYAAEMLSEKFTDTHSRDLIDAAIKEVEKSGTYEWAPTPDGDFFGFPESDPKANAASPVVTRENLLNSIATLKQQLASIPTRSKHIGHNQPPEEIGAPPYADDDKSAIADLLENAEDAISSDNPDIDKIRDLTENLGQFALRALKYSGSKINIVIDESLKTGTKITLAYLTFGDYLQDFIDSVKIFFGL